MPTYQYVCTECGEQLEAVQKFSDDPLTTCTACQGKLRKVFSAVGVVFKGSGFYRTDSRAGSNGAGKASSNGSGSTSSSESSSGSSSKDSGSGSSTTASSPAKASTPAA